VQSPDDVVASYRDKNSKISKGQAINVTETAHPDNPIYLVTDVAVNPNNIDDSDGLGERLDRIKQKTPDLDELHFDGGYGSSDNDEKFVEYSISPIQTVVRGRQSAVNIEIEQVSENEKALVFFIFKIVNERVNFMRFLYRFWVLQSILIENSVSTLPPGAKWRVESRCF